MYSKQMVISALRPDVSNAQYCVTASLKNGIKHHRLFSVFFNQQTQYHMFYLTRKLTANCVKSDSHFFGSFKLVFEWRIFRLTSSGGIEKKSHHPVIMVGSLSALPVHQKD